MRRQFCLTHTVRYDECDCYGFLTPAAFLRYMQDIASRDAEDAQLGGDGFWVVKRTIISFLRPVALHTPLLLRTYGQGFTRITAQRGYEAYSATDETQDMPLIRAHTLWVYVDKDGRPMRIPEGTAQIWLPDGPRHPQPDEPFPTIPVYEPERADATVRFSETDFMHHLNNAASVELLDNAAWNVYAQAGITSDSGILTPGQYDIEYIDSPRFGEKLEIQSWFEPFPARELAGAQKREFSKHQLITREGRTMIQAHSRWAWSSLS